MKFSQPTHAMELFNSLVAISVVSTIALLIALFLVRLRSKISAGLRCQILRLSLILSVATLLLFVGGVVRHSDEQDSLAVRQVPALEATPVAPESLSKIDFDPSLETESVSSDDSAVEVTEPLVASSNSRKTDLPATKSSSTGVLSKSLAVASVGKPSVSASRWEMSKNVARTMVTLWLAITGLLLLIQLVRLVRSTLFWRRKLAGHVSGDDQANLLAEFVDLDNVAVVCRDDIQIPMVVGVFRPVILLPTNLGHTTQAERRMIVRHERQHIARRDILWDLVGSALTAMIWFQPLAWMVLRQLRIEREIACDDAVLQDVGRPQEYAQLLTTLARAAVQPHASQAIVATMAVHSQIERRVISILNLQRCGYQKRSTCVGVQASFGMMVSVLAVLLLAQLPEIRAAATSPRPGSTMSQEAASVKPAKEAQQSTAESSGQPMPEGYYRIRGRVVDKQGAGVVGAKVFIEGRHQVSPTTVTNAAGNYELLVPVISDRKRWDHVIAIRVVDPATGKMGAIVFNPWHSELVDSSGQVISVPNIIAAVPPTVPVTVTDQNGKPVPDAFVGMIQSPTVLSVVKTDRGGVANVPIVRNTLPPENERAALLFALKDGEGVVFQELPVGEGVEPVTIGLSGAAPLKVYAQVSKPIDGDAAYKNSRSPDWNSLRSYGPASGVQLWPVRMPGFACSSLTSPFCPVTDEQGLVTIEWMPKDSEWRGQLETTDARYFNATRGFPFPPQNGEVAQLTLEPKIEIGGVVSDNRKQPLGNVEVECTFSSLSLENRFHSRKVASVRTDSTGKFSFKVPCGARVNVYGHRGNAFSSVVQLETINVHFGKRSIVDKYKKLGLTMTNENRVFGVVTSGPNRTPLAEMRVDLWRMVDNSDRVEFLPSAAPIDNPAVRSAFRASVQTDENGRYEFTTSDGEWLIQNPIEDPRQSAKQYRLAVSGGFETRNDFHSDTMTQLTIHVDSEERKAQQAKVRRIIELGGYTVPDNLYSPWRKVLRRKPRAIEVAGAYIAWDGSATQLTVTPGAKVKVSGRLIDAQGQSAGKRSIRYVVHPQVLDGFPLPSPVTDTISGQIDSEEDGTFELDMCLKDCDCEIQMTADEGIEWAKQRWVAVTKFTPASGAPIDMGDLQVPPPDE